MPTMQPCSVCKRKRGSESEIFTWQVVAIADSTVLKNYLIIQTRKCVSCAKHSQVDRKPKHRQLTHNHTVHTHHTLSYSCIYVCAAYVGSAAMCCATHNSRYAPFNLHNCVSCGYLFGFVNIVLSTVTPHYYHVDLR